MSAQRSASHRFSRQGFSPIPHDHVNMNGGDATIDIPLEQLPTDSPTGARRKDSETPFAREGTLRKSQSDARKRITFGGRRVKKIDSKGQPTGHIGYDGEEDTINRMGRIYKKILNFSIVTRYFVYVSPLALAIAVPIIVGATAAQDAKIAGVPLTWFFVWIEIVWLSLWVSKIVAHFLPYLFQVVAGVVSSGVRKYALVIKSLEIPLSLVGWSVTSLATFVPLMTRNPYNRAHDPNQKNWETIVNQILAAAVIATLVFLGEKFFIQIISINYHRKQFNSRIRESKRNVYLLSLLYEASRALFPAYCNEFAEEDYIIGDQINLSALGGLGSKNRSHRRSGSQTPMRLLQDVGRIGDKVTSAFGNVAQEITGKQVFNPNSAHSIVTEALEKRRSSEALAKRLWMSFVIEGKEALYQDDIIDVLGHEHEEEAMEAFGALDRDMNGDISLDEMIQVITQMSRDRKAIATSMHDVDQAINVLDRMLMTIVTIVIIFVFVAFLNKSFTTTLATAGTALLSLSFVFSATAAEVLGSCIFLFVKHPFDIGDRVDLGNDQLAVDHISLLFTVFRRISGANVGRTVQIPNNVLNTLWIENVSRSKAMKEQLTIQVSFDTTFEDIQILKQELLTFVTDKENARDFQPDIDVEVLGTSDMSKLELRVEVRHKSNWANETVRAARRSKFMCALVAALRRVPIYGPGGGGEALGSIGNPSYSVGVAEEFADVKRGEAAAAKEAKRLIPTKKEQPKEERSGASPRSPYSNNNGRPALGLNIPDAKIIDNLNSRDPGFDAARDEAWTASREDSSTLGERPSIDVSRQDLDEVRGLLRRESTKGKRKPGDAPSRTAMAHPSVPTIAEPQPPISYTDYAQQAEASMEIDNYEERRMNATGLAASAPSAYVNTNQQTSYVSPSVQQPASYMSPFPRTTVMNQPSHPLGPASEMRQMSRSPSNPYRTANPAQGGVHPTQRSNTFEEE